MVPTVQPATAAVVSGLDFFRGASLARAHHGVSVYQVRRFPSRLVLLCEGSADGATGPIYPRYQSIQVYPEEVSTAAEAASIFDYYDREAMIPAWIPGAWRVNFKSFRSA